MAENEISKAFMSKFRISKFGFRIFGEGFTLLETVVALALIVAAAIGPLTLASRGLFSSQFSTSKLIALNLAQESVEIIRQMRENNVIKGYDWRGLAGSCPSDCVKLADGSYQVDVYTLPSGSTPPLNTNSPLLYDAASALYSQSLGLVTPYTRVIVISTPGTDQMRVQATLTWQDAGIPRQVQLEEVFYNWR